MNTAWEIQVIKYYQQYMEVEKSLIDRNDIFGALAHFRIARNFSGISDIQQKEQLILGINNIVENTSLSSDEKYIHLFNHFKDTYKKELISATSKILWFTDSKESHIIYDTIALNNLTKIKGNVAGLGYNKYFSYRDKWQELYKENHALIESAINRVKDFLTKTPNFDVKSLIVMDSPWFKMRVLDMYLWSSVYG